MPSFEDNVQTLVDGLFSHSQETRLSCIKKIKHAIIGNRSKKSSFMLLGVIPRLVSLVAEQGSSTELVCEAVITLGSFAHGTSENVQAVLTAKALPLLIRGLFHSEPEVVSACIRTLRTLYLSDHAPSDTIFQDVAVARQLVKLLSTSPALIAQCAATVLAKACQSPEQQNLLCGHGVVQALSGTVQSAVPKLVQASLQTLAAVVYENKFSASVVSDATCNGQPIVTVLTKVLSSNHSNEAKLSAAQCLAYLCRAGALSEDSSVVTLKVLPALVRLCKRSCGASLRAESITALAYLTQGNPELQELAADSDRLLATLVDYLSSQPDEGDDSAERDAGTFGHFERLRQSVFLALASLAASREEIRVKVVSDRTFMKQLSEGLEGECVEIRVAATRCLHSLSRSTKLLRTSLVDSEVWRPCLALLEVRDEECLCVATGVLCNLLLAFSPSRKSLVEGGVVETLSILAGHDNETIRLNSVWALMSVAYDSTSDIKAKVKESFGCQRLFNLLSPSVEPKLLMKALGLLVNLLQHDEEADEMVLAHEDTLLRCLVTLLQESSSNEIIEQVLCALVNLSNASARTRGVLVHCDELLQCLAAVLRSSECASMLMAGCSVVRNLTDSAISEHVHRQNCLEKFGIRFAVQKLEKTNNSRLQSIIKDTLENFTSHTV